MKRKMLALLLLFAMLFVTIQISMSTAPFPDGEVPRISFIMRGNGADSQAALKQGAMKAADDSMLELHFVVLPDENGVEEQKAQIAREVEGGAQALVLSAADRSRLASIIESLEIPVITVGSGVDAVNVAADFSVDYQQMGQELGESICQTIPQAQAVALLRQGGIERSYYADFEAGLRQGMQQCVLQLVTVELPSEEMQAYLLAELEQLPHIAAILTMDMTELLAVAQAVDGKYPVYGFGSNSIALNLLEQGSITALAVPNTYSMGYQAAYAAGQLVRHPSETPQKVPIDYHIVTNENMYDAANEWLLFPMQ